MRHSRFEGNVHLQIAQVQAPASQAGIPRSLDGEDLPRAVVVREHEETVTLEVGAELERLPDDCQALVLRVLVGLLILWQPQAKVQNRLYLFVVLLLERNGAHLRPAHVHVEDVLPPEPLECNVRWGHEGLLEPV